MKKHQRGFTLIELIITIFGLGIICALIGGLVIFVHFVTKFW